MTKDEALKLALKALELVNIEFVCNGAHHAKKDRHEVGDERPVTDRYRQAIIAIEEALAQPTSGDYALGYSIGFGEGHSAGKALAQPKEPEPAAWRRKRFSPELGEYFEYKRRIFSKETDGEDWTPLYTTPTHCKPLPYEQLDSLWQTTDTGDFELDIREFARAIEAAHGIKE